MSSYKQEFIEFALKNQVLLFGEFKLKSGRISPYFFNAGQFNSGAKISQLGKFYAHAVQQAQLEYDVIFGPAYKGVPLATSLAIALAEQYGIDKPFCFNRKEKKQHGEGGTIIGAPLNGRVLVVDDVISAGLTIAEVVAIILNAGAQLAGIVISIDRQERGQNHLSAIEEVRKKYAAPVICIATLSDIMEYLEHQGMQEKLKGMRQYKAEYGA